MLRLSVFLLTTCYCFSNNKINFFKSSILKEDLNFFYHVKIRDRGQTIINKAQIDFDTIGKFNLISQVKSKEFEQFIITDTLENFKVRNIHIYKTNNKGKYFKIIILKGQEINNYPFVFRSIEYLFYEKNKENIILLEKQYKILN